MRRLALLLVLASLPAFADDEMNGHAKKYPRTWKTSEPASTQIVDDPVPVPIDTQNATVHGTMFAWETPLPDGEYGQCTPQQEGLCWMLCEQGITDPYCAQVGSYCSNSTCYCHYFCAKDSNGAQHTPKHLAWVDQSGE